MKITTEDCKKFLEDHRDVVGEGPWKRVSKKNVPEGVNRVFANATGSRLVTLLEKGGVLSLDVDTVGEKELFPYNIYQEFPADYGFTDDEILEVLDYDDVDHSKDDCRVVMRSCDRHKSSPLLFDLEGEGGGGEDDMETEFMAGFMVEGGYFDDQSNRPMHAMLHHILSDQEMLETELSESAHVTSATRALLRKRFTELKFVNYRSAKKEAVQIPVKLPLDHMLFDPRHLDGNYLEHNLNFLMQFSRIEGPQLVFLDWEGISPDKQMTLKRWLRQNKVGYHALLMTPDGRKSWVATHAENVFNDVFVTLEGRLATIEEATTALPGFVDLLR